MGKPSYLKCSRKYGMPLYGAVWLPSAAQDEMVEENEAHVSSILVGGGGGDPQHGIKNRLVVAEYNRKSNELSDEVFCVQAAEVPLRLAVHPKDGVLCAFDKSCKLYEYKPADEKNLVSSGEELAALEGKDAQKIVFSSDGTRLATGGEDGHLRVFEWPSLKVIMEREESSELAVRDADFSMDAKYLATTASASPCRIWDISNSKLATSLKNDKGGSLGLCRFSRNTNNSLFITIVKGGEGHVGWWDTSNWDEPSAWKQLGSRRIHADPISSFAISPSGKYLATGSSEGEIAVLDVSRMSVIQRLKGAHMIFITAMEFSPDEGAVLSVSADASMRVTALTVRSSGTVSRLLLLVFLIVVFMSIFLFFHDKHLLWKMLGDKSESNEL